MPQVVMDEEVEIVVLSAMVQHGRVLCYGASDFLTDTVLIKDVHPP